MHPPFYWGGWGEGGEPSTEFSKRRGLAESQFLEGDGVSGKEGMTILSCSFTQKIKSNLKYLMLKKVYK